METTRRSFLKIVASVSAAAFVPLRLIAEDAPLANNEKLVAMVRETFHFDIDSSSTIVRHDVRTRDIQLGVDAWLPQDGEAWYRNADLEVARQAAVDVLRAELDTRGIRIADLVPLPQPAPMQLNSIGTFTPTRG